MRVLFRVHILNQESKRFSRFHGRVVGLSCPGRKMQEALAAISRCRLGLGFKELDEIVR